MERRNVRRGDGTISASWEIKKHADILIGILHTWNIHPDWALGMLRMQKAPFGHRTSIAYRWEHDKPYDLSRNQLAKELLDSGVEWLLFIDSDIIPPPNGLERLLENKLPIVGGLYWRRHPNVFAEIFKFRPGTTQLDPIPNEQIGPSLNEVDGIGCGFLLIHRRVFEDLKDKVKKLTIPSEGTNYECYEFFKFAATEPPFVSEDLYFCIAARLAGWKIYCDATVRCQHIISSMVVKEGRPEWSPLERGHD